MEEEKENSSVSHSDLGNFLATVKSVAGIVASIIAIVGILLGALLTYIGKDIVSKDSFSEYKESQMAAQIAFQDKFLKGGEEMIRKSLSPITERIIKTEEKVTDIEMNLVLFRQEYAGEKQRISYMIESIQKELENSKNSSVSDVEYATLKNEINNLKKRLDAAYDKNELTVR